MLLFFIVYLYPLEHSTSSFSLYTSNFIFYSLFSVSFWLSHYSSSFSYLLCLEGGSDPALCSVILLLLLSTHFCYCLLCCVFFTLCSALSLSSIHFASHCAWFEEFYAFLSWSHKKGFCTHRFSHSLSLLHYNCYFCLLFCCTASVYICYPSFSFILCYFCKLFTLLFPYFPKREVVL